ncbi:zinc-ribbon domain-containing protein [Butyricicoccus pullicaecorum]|uniref:zinc-ribbon domain-containing protein n=1 Tax=Butyricicoccus pullicaecorum TaxID=501571 RepID=UPI001FA8EF05|nr:zinc-ribbon domain-containing protein [Butyricicoccus pullicaecorum]
MVIPKENDLATEFPEIAAQWHPTKNGTCTAYDVTSGSRRKIWWICDKGHAW